MDIITILIQSIQGVATILIIIGMLIAFFWKLSFYINLGLGLIITIIVAYLVSVISGNGGLAFTIFFAGLIVSFLIALIGGFLCLLEGFVLSTIGLLALWISGSPTSTFSSDTLVGSAIAGAFLTGIAAYFGDRAVSLSIFKGLSLNLMRDTKTQGPIEFEILPEEDELLKKRVYGYVIGYRTFKLEDAAQRFGLTTKQFENILLDYLAEGKIEGIIDSKRGMFSLKEKGKPYNG